MMTHMTILFVFTKWVGLDTSCTLVAKRWLGWTRFLLMHINIEPLFYFILNHGLGKGYIYLVYIQYVNVRNSLNIMDRNSRNKTHLYKILNNLKLNQVLSTLNLRF